MAVWALAPVYVNICETAQYSGAQDCTKYQIVHAILQKGFLILSHAEIWTALATFAIAAFTWTLKRSTDRLWRASENQIRLARDDFNATHRPWIPITNSALSYGVKWASGNAIIGIDIFCKNIGSSPARRVSLAVRIFPFLVNDDIPREIAKLQAAHPSDGAARYLIEHTLFPGMSGEFCLSRGLVIPDTKIANLKNGWGDPATEMVPVILGFIEYYFSFGEPIPHYTPFVYHLWITDAERFTRQAIQLNGRNIDAKDLILVPLINAGDPT